MKKVVSALLTMVLCFALAVPAFAANYSKWIATEFSGQTDFGYFYTYAGQDQSTYPYQDANYKCFSVVSADGQRFYAAIKDTQYEYAKAALDHQQITLKGLYQQTAGDGSPIFLASEVVTTNEKGEKVSTPFGNVVWAAIDHGKIKTDEPRTLDFSGVRGFLVTNVCIVQRSAA